MSQDNQRCNSVHSFLFFVVFFSYFFPECLLRLNCLSLVAAPSSELNGISPNTLLAAQEEAEAPFAGQLKRRQEGNQRQVELNVTTSLNFPEFAHQPAGFFKIGF